MARAAGATRAAAGDARATFDADPRRCAAQDACQVWGVLNCTPDSFSDGGLYREASAAIAHAAVMLADGADVIDVGGASSRPRGKLYGDGATEVSSAQETSRVLPVIEALAADGVTVSIDTTSAEVARAALDAGASIINDVSCGRSAALVELAAARGVDYVLMHTRDRGQVTQENTRYRDVVRDVRDELLAAVERLVAAGVARERIWLDPGLGFAKTAAQSLALLSGTATLVETGHRVLVGPSRKGFIAEVAPDAGGQRPAPGQRDGGTAAAVAAAVLSGAHAVRVHEVASMRQAALVAAALRQGAVP